jgi:hypothetical protein
MFILINSQFVNADLIETVENISGGLRIITASGTRIKVSKPEEVLLVLTHVAPKPDKMYVPAKAEKPAKKVVIE